MRPASEVWWDAYEHPTEQECVAIIEADRAELVADVFSYLIAKAQEPVEIFTGSFAKPLHADDRTAWLEKMRGEYGA